MAIVESERWRFSFADKIYLRSHSMSTKSTIEQPDGPKSDYIFRTDHLMNGLGGRTARGGLVTMLAHGCKFAISIVATAILARLLTRNDFGLAWSCLVLWRASTDDDHGRYGARFYFWRFERTA